MVNYDSNLLLCFAENTGSCNAFYAELLGAMRAIELAKLYNWKNLWLECDSSLVINAIHNHSPVPLPVRNRWENCLDVTRTMNLMATRVYREGNTCVDALANVGLSLNHLTIWLHVPECIREFFW